MSAPVRTHAGVWHAPQPSSGPAVASTAVAAAASHSDAPPLADIVSLYEECFRPGGATAPLTPLEVLEVVRLAELRWETMDEAWGDQLSLDESRLWLHYLKDQRPWRHFLQDCEATWTSDDTGSPFGFAHMKWVMQQYAAEFPHSFTSRVAVDYYLVAPTLAYRTRFTAFLRVHVDLQLHIGGRELHAGGVEVVYAFDARSPERPGATGCYLILWQDSLRAGTADAFTDEGGAPTGASLVTTVCVPREMAARLAHILGALAMTGTSASRAAWIVAADACQPPEWTAWMRHSATVADLLVRVTTLRRGVPAEAPNPFVVRDAIRGAVARGPRAMEPRLAPPTMAVLLMAQRSAPVAGPNAMAVAAGANNGPANPAQARAATQKAAQAAEKALRASQAVWIRQLHLEAEEAAVQTDESWMYDLYRRQFAPEDAASLLSRREFDKVMVLEEAYAELEDGDAAIEWFGDLPSASQTLWGRYNSTQQPWRSFLDDCIAVANTSVTTRTSSGHALGRRHMKWVADQYLTTGATFGQTLSPEVQAVRLRPTGRGPVDVLVLQMALQLTMGTERMRVGSVALARVAERGPPSSQEEQEPRTHAVHLLDWHDGFISGSPHTSGASRTMIDAARVPERMLGYLWMGLSAMSALGDDVAALRLQMLPDTLAADQRVFWRTLVPRLFDGHLTVIEAIRLLRSYGSGLGGDVDAKAIADAVFAGSRSAPRPFNDKLLRSVVGAILPPPVAVSDASDASLAGTKHARNRDNPDGTANGNVMPPLAKKQAREAPLPVSNGALL
jgi:hypothetical protein